MKFSSSLSLGLVALAIIPQTFAAEKAKRVYSEAPIIIHRSSEVRADSPSTSANRFGLGFATGAIGGTATNTALSGWIDFGEKFSIQPVAAIGTTRQTFQFGAGAFFRATMHGNQNNGFHVGGGLTLGTLRLADKTTGVIGSEFYTTINGLVGFHFILPHTEHIGMSFDGGPALEIVNGDSNFSLQALSSFLGWSIYYFF